MTAKFKLADILKYDEKKNRRDLYRGAFKDGALEEVKLLEVFNCQNFEKKTYNLIKRYCWKRIKELESEK